MASVSQGYTDLQTAITALGAEESSVASAIAALQQQVASGSPVTGDQLEALATQVSTVTTQLQTAIAPPATTGGAPGTPAS